MPLPLVAAGLAIGLLYGLFGIGSAFATPVLALLGVPPLTAVVAPLPSMLPSSFAGAWSYARAGHVDRRLAGLALVAAAPAAVLGSLGSGRVGGEPLLVLSGFVLLAAGVRVVVPTPPTAAERAAARRERTGLVLVATATIGLLAGLLANGGGFLLVPLFLVAFGLEVPDAAGTSLVVATAITVPSIVAHGLLGDLVWAPTAAFAAGMVPGTIIGARASMRWRSPRLRTAFGVLLVAFAAWYLWRVLR